MDGLHSQARCITCISYESRIYSGAGERLPSEDWPLEATLFLCLLPAGDRPRSATHSDIASGLP